MAAWSNLLRSAVPVLIGKNTQLANNALKNGIIISRNMSDHERTMHIVPSRWLWDKTKDLFHLYFMVGAIPLTLVVILANIFVGPATLSPIPEGYVPKEWEYCKSPIARFHQRYFFQSDQMNYEKYIFYLWEEQEQVKYRTLERRVKKLMKERKDYQAYYFVPYTNAEYVRRQAQKNRDQRELYDGH